MSLIARLTKHLTLDLSLTPAAKARRADERRKARHNHAAHRALEKVSAAVHAELKAAVKA